jgi:hypothetical protein
MGKNKRDEWNPEKWVTVDIPAGVKKFLKRAAQVNRSTRRGMVGKGFR